MPLNFRSLIISILALWRDLSWKQVAASMRLNPDWVYKTLRRREMPNEDFGRLLPHVQRRPAEVLVVTRCLEELEALDQEQDLTDAEQEEVERGVLEASRHLRAHLVEGVRLSRGVPSLDGYPKPSEVEPARWQAGMLWILLKDMTDDQRSVVVKSVREFQSWALLEKVCEESVVEASRDLERAASLARLAEVIAAKIRGPEGWRNRCLGYAAAHLPNVQRVLGNLQTARAGLERAKALWEAGSDPDRVLDPGRLLDLEASLYRDERRFEESLDCLDRALPVSHRPGHVLIKKGFTLEVMGEYELAIETLLQGRPLVERLGDSRLMYMACFNLAVNYTHLDRFAEAEELARVVFKLSSERGDHNEVTRVIWLEGRIAAGLGHSAKALTLLERAAQEFETRTMWYDVALARLEIATLLLEAGRGAEVEALAKHLGIHFRAQGVHREALAALRLFQEAVARGHFSTALARGLLSFLFRARYDQSLQFTTSGAFGAAVRVHPAPCVEIGLRGLATEAAGVHPATCVKGALPVLPGTAAESVRVPATSCIDGRTAPEPGEIRQELVDKGQVAGRGQKRGGEGDSDKSGSHGMVSGAAPAPGLHGPGGPRLPGMVRQTGGKNSPDFLAAARPGWKTLLVRLFRALCGETQKAFAEALDVEPAVVAQYELGKCEPGPELLERMALRADLTNRAGEEVLHFADTLRKPRQRAGLGGLPGELAAVAARVYQRLLRLPLAVRPPKADDRRHVDELWSRLKDLTEEQQLTVVRVGPEFQSWALAEWLMEESVTEASRDLERAASLARLARVAERVPGSEDWRNRIRGYAEAALPNVFRVAGELEAARAGIEQAKQLWAAGSDPQGLLDPGRLLELEASLCRDERRFPEALKLLDEALPVSRQKGRVLIKKGFTLEAMGEYERAIETLLEAEPLIDPEAEPRLAYMRRFNLAVNYTHLGEFKSAVRLVEQVREVAAARGDRHEVTRVTWLEGRIAAGLGRATEATRLLEQARQEFAERDMWYDVALADLEIAPLLLAEGRTAKVKKMAAELVEKFEEQGIHREALAAVRLFREAADREKATAELARRVLRFLFRSRWDEGLRFGEG